MTIQEVIDRILAYHPTLPDYENRPNACDGVKFGNPSIECTGIVTAITATVDVIREAIKLGYNMIYVHEPSFYGHKDYTDYLEGDEVYEEKCELLRQGNIVFLEIMTISIPMFRMESLKELKGNTAGKITKSAIHIQAELITM